MRPRRIDRVVPGQVPSMVDSALANRVIDLVNAFGQMRTIGCELSISGDQAVLQVSDQEAQGVGAGAGALPFQVINASDDTGARVSVTPGYSQYLEPTIGAVSLFATPPPTLPLTSAGEWHIWLRATVDTDESSVNFARIVSASIVAHRPSSPGNLIDSSWTPLERFQWPILRLAVVEVVQGDNTLEVVRIRNSWASDVVWLQTFDRWVASGTVYIPDEV